MSFYGSTYYQLINAFYRIFVNNTGAEIKSFPTETPDGSYESTASGRQETIQFNTGNRWIGITQDDSDLHTFNFWHNAPVPPTNHPEYTLKPTPPTSEAEVGQSGYIWEPGTWLKFPDLQYDEAGHLVPKMNPGTWIQIPKSETDVKIGELDGRMETVEGHLNGSVDEDGVAVLGLLERTTNVENQADGLDVKTGNVWGYECIYPSIYTQSDKAKYNLTSAIGNLEDANTSITGDTQNIRRSVCDLLKILHSEISNTDTETTVLMGYVERLQDAIKVLEDSSIPDLEAKITTNTTNISTNASEIARVESRFDSVTTNLQTQISSNDTELADHEARLVSQKNRLDGHDTDISNINTKITNLETKHNTDIDTVNKSIADLKDKHDTAVEVLSGDIDTLEAKHDQAVSDITTRISELTNAHNSDKQNLENADTGLSERITSNANAIVLLQNADGVINQTIGGISTKVTTAETDIKNLEEQISKVNTDITDVSGRVTTLEDIGIVTKFDTLQQEHTIMDGRLASAENDINVIEAILNDDDTNPDEIVRGLKSRVSELEIQVTELWAVINQITNPEPTAPDEDPTTPEGNEGEGTTE